MKSSWCTSRDAHPRPDFMRSWWQSLDGEWEFDFDDSDKGLCSRWYEVGKPLKQKILVPFVYQSKLSGIGVADYHPIIWYKRKFSLAAQHTRERIIMRFGAVDHECIVFVNGEQAGTHVGGYDSFFFDISPWLKEGTNEVCLRVVDTRSRTQPRGKQYWDDGLMGCWYTPSSGIWQSVYLESVGSHNLAAIYLTPDFDTYSLSIEVELDAEPKGEVALEAEIQFEGQLIRKLSSSVPNKRFELGTTVWGGPHVDSTRAWAPQTPNLYDVILRLRVDGELVDEVSTYFGMRKVEVSNGQVLLNNQPIYQRLVLDQGYWLDSLLTPPDGEALKRDVELIKAFGFNGVRKHQKIEDPRFYYWCDKLGLLCWAELPSAYEFCRDEVVQLSQAMQQFILRDYNHPSIIVWVPLNESWGVREIYSNERQQQASLMLYHLCKSLDSTRIVSGNDGWEQTITDVIGLHDYSASGEVIAKHFQTWESAVHTNVARRMSFAEGYAPTGDEPMLVTEYGGIAMSIAGIQGEIENMSTWGYHDKVNSEDAFFERYQSVTDAIRDLPFCRGYCYTQLTDVMQEINGLLLPDRTPKVNPERFAALNTSPKGYYN